MKQHGLEVGICSSSSFMASLQATLQAGTGVRVRWLGCTLVEAVAEIKMLSPHVVLFEMKDADQAIRAKLLHTHPEILLIGIEPESYLVTAFSVSQHTVFSMEEMTQTIMKAISAKQI